jgi:hypothetical protein
MTAAIDLHNLMALNLHTGIGAHQVANLKRLHVRVRLSALRFEADRGERSRGDHKWRQVVACGG